MELRLGDRVRISIPDETDPDFEFHGEHAIIIDIKRDECPCGYGMIIRAALEDRDLTLDVHPWDVRPPIRAHDARNQG